MGNSEKQTNVTYNELEIQNEADDHPSKMTRFSVRDAPSSRSNYPAAIALGALSAAFLFGSLTESKKTLQKKHDEDVKQIQNLQINLNRETDSKKTLNSQKQKLEEDKRKLQSQISIISSQLVQLQSDHRNLTESKNALQEKHDEDVKQIQNLQINLTRETDMRKELIAQKQKLEVQMQSQISIISSQLVQLQSDHRNLIESKNALQEKHDEDVKQIQNLQINLTRETDMRKELIAQKQKLEEDIRKMQSQISIISSQLVQLQSDHKNLIESKNALQEKHDEDVKQIQNLQISLTRETDMRKELIAQKQKLEEDIRKMQSQISTPEGRSGKCLPNWLQMNSRCFYFSVSSTTPRRDWNGGRDDCKKKGADLVIIDSKEKQEFIVKSLKTHYNLQFSYNNGFWIGLKDDHAEGTWKWLNETPLTKGYWRAGEPNDYLAGEDCAAVYSTENPMQAWNDAPCSYSLNWICEKEAL